MHLNSFLLKTFSSRHSLSMHIVNNLCQYILSHIGNVINMEYISDTFGGEVCHNTEKQLEVRNFGISKAFKNAIANHCFECGLSRKMNLFNTKFKDLPDIGFKSNSISTPTEDSFALMDGPLARYVKWRVTQAPGKPGTFSPPPRVSDSDMHHDTCVTHVLWCMPWSLTSGFLWIRWRGERSRDSRCMRNPQFYVSSKRPFEHQCQAVHGNSNSNSNKRAFILVILLTFTHMSPGTHNFALGRLKRDHSIPSTSFTNGVKSNTSMDK